MMVLKGSLLRMETGLHCWLLLVSFLRCQFILPTTSNGIVLLLCC
jgi:hypothetical protein